MDKKHFFGSEQRTRARAHAHTHAHIVDSTGNISVGRFTLFSVRVRACSRARFLLPRLFLHLTPQRFFHLLHRRSSILPEKALLPSGVHHAYLFLLDGHGDRVRVHSVRHHARVFRHGQDGSFRRFKLLATAVSVFTVRDGEFHIGRRRANCRRRHRSPTSRRRRGRPRAKSKGSESRRKRRRRQNGGASHVPGECTGVESFVFE